MLLVRSCCSQSGECYSIFIMGTVGHAHWRTRMGHRQIFPRTMGAVLPRTMSQQLRRAGGKKSVRAEPWNKTDVLIASYEICEIISAT